MANQPQPLMTEAQAAEMLRLQRRADRRGGCLFAVVMSLLFGWFYWGWLALKWSVRGTVVLLRWSWQVNLLLWRWSWRGCVACWQIGRQAGEKAWPHIQQYAQAFHTRYGAKGWAALAGIVLVLSLLGTVLGNH